MGVLEDLSPEDLEGFDKLDRLDRIAILAHLKWIAAAKAHQIMPSLDDESWNVWMILAGRGAGKTKAAVEAVWWYAWRHPKARCGVMAPTSGDLAKTVFRGQSGFINVIPPDLVADYNKSDHLITLVNGSQIQGYPGEAYERLRGPEHEIFWCLIPGTLIDLPDGSRVPIETIQAGEMVATRWGARMVTAAGISGNPAGLVTIRSGAMELTGTEDHPILANDGEWIPMGQLKPGDRVWQACSTTASHGIRSDQATSGISAEGLCTAGCGSNTTDQSLKAGSSTTRTTIQPTTTSATWRSCLSAITSAFTWLVSRRPRSRRSVLGLVWSSLRGLLSEACAYSAALRSLRWRWVTQDVSAETVVLSVGGTSRFSLGHGPAIGVARTSASTDSGTSSAPSSAGCRVPRRLLFPVLIESVERSQNSKTYSLTVEGDPEFIANGFVVHNCDELAAFQYLGEGEAWDMMQFGLRLGQHPRVIVTTTPKPKDLILELVAREDEDVIIDRASTFANKENLAQTFIDKLESYKGTKLYQQEVLGEVVDLEDGKTIQRSMFRLWPASKPFPEFLYIVQSYDTAFTEKEHNDPTAATTWGVFQPQDGPTSVMLIDCWQDHLTFPMLKPKIIEEFSVSYGDVRQKRPDLILVENKASGISIIQELQKAHLPCVAYNPGRADKMQRLQIAATALVAKRVWLPESAKKKGFVKDWVEPALSQWCSFPDATNDDFVDSMSAAMRYLMDSGWIKINPEARSDDDDLVDTKRKKENPYSA